MFDCVFSHLEGRRPKGGGQVVVFMCCHRAEGTSADSGIGFSHYLSESSLLTGLPIHEDFQALRRP